jgi:hypothetical protein
VADRLRQMRSLSHRQVQAPDADPASGGVERAYVDRALTSMFGADVIDLQQLSADEARERVVGVFQECMVALRSGV